PRWLYTFVYLALGWVAVFYLVPFWREGGPVVVGLIAAGGLLYTLGAVVYALKRPNPSPRWFGFHEVFHSFTVLAFGAHWTAALADRPSAPGPPGRAGAQPRGSGPSCGSSCAAPGVRACCSSRSRRRRSSASRIRRSRRVMSRPRNQTASIRPKRTRNPPI